MAVSDAAENQWLAQQYHAEFPKKSNENALSAAVFIGLHRADSRWVWSSGEPVRFQATWWNGRPYEGEGQDHVALLTAKDRHAVWVNTLNRPALTDDYPRGVIELPGDAVPPLHRPHLVELLAGKENQVNFGFFRSGQ